MSAGKACTTMIVDDSFFMRNLLRSILEMEGYTVMAEAEGGEEAVAKYRVCRPNLVLMDLLMPIKNGIEATREIIGLNGSACVVMCSVAGQEQSIRSALEAGARGFISKPFSVEEVMAVLQKALGLNTF